MFVLANFISAIAQILDFLLLLLEMVIFIRVALSWIDAYSHNEAVRVVGGILLGVVVAYYTGGIVGLVMGVVIAVLTIIWIGTLISAFYPITDIVLKPFRRLLPPWRSGGWDLSPVFAILAIEFVRKFLIPTLLTLSDRLR